MGKITLSEGFSVIPEGTYVFRIVEVNYKEAFGKIDVKMKTAKGQTHTEHFSLLKTDGSTNEKALNAFSYFAKVATGDFDLQDIDPEELVGLFMECDVEHDVQPSNRDPRKTVTFIRLAGKRHADRFEGEPVSPTPVQPEDIDLGDLLG